MKNFFTIIGGMGTISTELFIHELNKRTKANCDQDYLNYILVNHATIPDRTRYIMDHSNPNPFEFLSKDIQQQSLLHPSFFVIPCNTAHYFYNKLQSLTSIRILNMIQEALKYIRKLYPKARKIGLLATQGTIEDHIYENEIKKFSYEYVCPSKDIQKETNILIYDDIKKNNYVDPDLYHNLVYKMINNFDCDVVILGCTELSLAQSIEPIYDLPLVDSQSILVDKTLELGLKLKK